MDAAALLIAALALLTSVASAFYAKGTAREAERANHLSESARSTAIHLEHSKWIKLRNPPAPGELKYSAFHPRTMSARDFDPKEMYLESTVTGLNMGPGTCYRVRAAVKTGEFEALVRKKMLPPGETFELRTESASADMPKGLVFEVTWRDELGVDHTKTLKLDESGYFEGIRVD